MSASCTAAEGESAARAFTLVLPPDSVDSDPIYFGPWRFCLLGSNVFGFFNEPHFAQALLGLFFLFTMEFVDKKQKQTGLARGKTNW